MIVERRFGNRSCENFPGTSNLVDGILRTCFDACVIGIRHLQVNNVCVTDLLLLSALHLPVNRCVAEGYLDPEITPDF